MLGAGDMEKHLRSETSGLNSRLVRYPLLTPLIGFAIAGTIFAFLYFTGYVGGPLLNIGQLVAGISFFMLVYGLIRKIGRFVRKVLSVKYKPYVPIIRQFCLKDGHAVNYEEGIAKMTQQLALQMNMSNDQAKQIVIQLIKKGMLEYTLSGVWICK